MAVRTRCLILLLALGGVGGFAMLTCSSGHLPANDNGAGGGRAGGGRGRMKMKSGVDA